MYTRASSDIVVTMDVIHNITVFQLVIKPPTITQQVCQRMCHPPAGFGPQAKKAELFPR